MIYLVTFLHVVVCLALIGVVLLQTGKRADLAGAFGGGGSQTAFGTRGAATFLAKATTAAAVLFMLTSLGLSVLSSRTAGRDRSILEQVQTPPASTAPAPVQGTGETGLPAEQNTPPATEEGQTPAPVPEAPATEEDLGQSETP